MAYRCICLFFPTSTLISITFIAMSAKPTVDTISSFIAQDLWIKVAGIDADGILRGKVISKKKFLSIVKAGFGFCSVIFGWDMHDKTYPIEQAISNQENGYKDLLAIVDISSFRRIPWESGGAASRKGMPFFLVHFADSLTEEPIAPCPRSLLRTVCTALKSNTEINALPYSGVEFEFFQYKETSDSVLEKGGVDLTPITPGMFGYSLLRLGKNVSYQEEMLKTCTDFDIGLEGWHTETGPGVFETAIGYCPAEEIADKATLFKFVAKTVGAHHNILPCFMAKPKQGLPGNSGHIHVSLLSNDKHKTNLFARPEPDLNPEFEDSKYLSDLGRHFLAGVLAGMPDIMPLLAPNVNSYKRLVENFWAPVTVSWGLEHRIASIRLISPPLADPRGTRFEIRTPGADVHPHYALAAIFGLGMRGIEKKLPLTIPPMGTSSPDKFERLPRNLRSATERFMAQGSLAREVLGDSFVEHYGATRLHEANEWDDAVTNWEVQRYIETA